MPELRVSRRGAVRVVRTSGAGDASPAAAAACSSQVHAQIPAQIATSAAAHDVTGGLAAKLAAAAAIAARGIPVVIVQAGTEHAAAALAGDWPAVATVVMREGAAWPPRWE